MLTLHQFGLAVTIVFGALVSEDAAVLAAATLSATRVLDLKLAWAGAVLGLSLGDFALYCIARLVTQGALQWPFARKALANDLVIRCGAWCQTHSRSLLFFSRAIPGMRLPTTLACGVFGMSAPEFLAVSFAGASLWVVLIFFLIHSAQRSSRNLLLFSIASIVASIAAAQTVRALLPHFQRILRRVKRWEFWPAWLFYIPVAFIYTCLALRFRGFTLPAAANPGQLNGGIIGESKAEILRELQVVAPNHVARSFLLSGAERNARINLLLANQQLEFPFVLKPDLGQRGAGFRIIRNSTDLDAYLASVPSDLIAQQYAAGPGEAGIFYYRLPDEPGGHILAITDKIFPAVRGDGRRTLRELIKSDERASFIADTYLSRLSSRANEIVNAGETVRLVEAGNHCQGCIFADGARLNSNSLLDTIDRISQSLSGFYIGRYDVRYATEEDLRAGRFTIIELNGAASEVTSIYDAGHSLASAYRMLYRQWHLVFAIAHVNRRRGFRPASPMQLLRCWREYCRISAAYPGAD